MRRTRNRATARPLMLALLLAAAVGVVAQERFQFVISVADTGGQPVTDLRANEILMSEDGVANEILKVEPFRLPVELTIAVDNGPLSRDALSHYRSGLTGLVKALPAEVEVTLITTAPQPLMVVRATTDRARILRGVNGFAPEDARPRFTDALVEFAKRYEDELTRSRRIDSLPVLVMVSTSANEASSYEVPEISRALGFLEARKARVFVAVTSTHAAAAGASINDNRQALIAIPATKATGGTYEALSASSRLATLLPEWGEAIAAHHRLHYHQVLVTAERARGITGPLRNPRVEVTRPGVTGRVSLDGMP